MEKCRAYFVDHPGVCDLPYGHEGEHHFADSIMAGQNLYVGPVIMSSVEEARSNLLYRIRRSSAIPQDVDDLIAVVRAETAMDRRINCVENTSYPRCRYRGKGDPPQDCDYPECGCVDEER